MPTIITKGQLPAERRYRMTCYKCGTVFEFLHKETRPSRDPRDRDVVEIKCPLPGCDQTAYPGPAHLVPNEQPSKLHFPPGVRGGAVISEAPNYYRDH